MIARPRHAAGFSLLEVMIAFVITTLALAVLSQIFGQGSRHLDLSRDYTQALEVAENLMAEFGRPESADSETHTDTMGPFHWRVKISPYLLPSRVDAPPVSPTARRDDVRIVRIAVEVDWNRSGKSRRVALESLRIVTNGTDAT